MQLIMKLFLSTIFNNFLIKGITRMLLAIQLFSFILVSCIPGAPTNPTSEDRDINNPTSSDISPGASQAISLSEDVSKTFTLNSGSGATNLYYRVVTEPQNGILTNCLLANTYNSINCTYTPNENFSGEDFFTYKVNDGTSDSITVSRVSLTITPVDDNPTVTDIDDKYMVEGGVLNNVSFYVDEGVGTVEDQDSIRIKIISSNTNIIATSGISLKWKNQTLTNSSTVWRLNDGSSNAKAYPVLMTIHPVSENVSTDFEGPVKISIYVSEDNGITWHGKTPYHFKVYISGQNNNPTITNIDGPIIANEGATIPNHQINIDEGGGLYENSQSVTITITSNDQTIIRDDKISILKNGAELNRNGNEFIINDLYDDASTTPLYIKLTQELGASTSTPIYLDLVATDSLGGSTTLQIPVMLYEQNSPPIFYSAPDSVPIGASTIPEGGQLAFTIYVDEGGASDEDLQQTTLTITSGNTSVVDHNAGDIIIEGGGNTYTTPAGATSDHLQAINVLVNPAQDPLCSGATIPLTLSLSDSLGGGPTTKTILVQWTPVNQDATITNSNPTTDITKNEGATLQDYLFTADEAGGIWEDGQSLDIRVTLSAAGDLAIQDKFNISGKWGTTNLAYNNITHQFLLGDGALDAASKNFKLTLDPIDDDFNTAISGDITVLVEVKETTSGAWQDSTSFLLTINAENDAPVFNTTLSDLSNKSTAEGSTIPAFNIYVDEGGFSDEDAEEITFSVSAVASNGYAVDENATITIDGVLGSSYTTNNPGADNESTATPFEIAPPHTDFFGTVTYTITATDSNGLSASKDIAITWTSVNDAPTILFPDGMNVTVDEDDTYDYTITVNEGDVDSTIHFEDFQNTTLELVSSDTTLLPVNKVKIVRGVSTYTFGANGRIDLIDNLGDIATNDLTMKITAGSNLSGAGTYTLRAYDGETWSNNYTINVTVDTVNDKPTITSISDQKVYMMESFASIATTIDEGGGSDEDTDQVDIQIISSNTSVVDNTTINAYYGSDRETASAIWGKGGYAGGFVTIDTAGNNDISENDNKVFIEIEPIAGVYGDTTITVNIRDSGVGLKTNSTTFDLVVKRVISSHGGWKEIIAKGPIKDSNNNFVNEFGICSNLSYTTKFTCEDNGETWYKGTCSDGFYKEEGVCTAEDKPATSEWLEGTCSGIGYTTSATCIAAGYTWTTGSCSNRSYRTVATCTSHSGTWITGYCSDTSITSSAACIAPNSWNDGYCSNAFYTNYDRCISKAATWINGICSRPEYTTKFECLNANNESWNSVAGTCSNSTYITQTTCENAKTNTWTEGYCDDAKYKTKADCESSKKVWTKGVCSDGTSLTSTACVQANKTWYNDNSNETPYVKISWNTFQLEGTDLNGSTVEGWNIFRSELGSDESNFNFRNPINTSTLESSTKEFVDTTLTNNDLGKVIWYQVRPVVKGRTTGTNETTLSSLRIIVPPTNKTLLHRWVINREMCQKITGISMTESYNNYKCEYIGPGSTYVDDDDTSYYDIKFDLLIDTYEAGCNFTRGSGKCSGQGLDDIGCIGNIDPEDPLTPVTANSGSIYYSRGNGKCYINTDGAQTWKSIATLVSENGGKSSPDMSTTLPMLTQAQGVPPLTHITQLEAYRLCEKTTTTITNNGSIATDFPVGANVLKGRIPSRKESFAASLWPSTYSSSTINTYESGVNLYGATTSGACNTKYADGLIFTDALLDIDDYNDNLPGNGSSQIKSLITGSNSTNKCVGLFGVRDIVGNVKEWAADRIFCDPVNSGNDCQAVADEDLAMAYVGTNKNYFLKSNPATPNTDPANDYFFIYNYSNNTYQFDGKFGPCIDEDLDDTCDTGDNSLSSWPISAKKYTTDDMFYPMALPIYSPTITAGYESLTYSSIGTGITSAENLHSDTFNINANNLTSNPSATVIGLGGLTYGGSYKSNGNSAGTFTFNFIDAFSSDEKDVGFRCVIPVQYYH